MPILKNTDELTVGTNEIPDPIEENSLSSLNNESEMMEIDEYHSEVGNRAHLRGKVFLKWDTGNGVFKVGDQIIACGPNQKDLICTLHTIKFVWQYWKDMALVCDNLNLNAKPKIGDWREGDEIIKRPCGECPKNSENGAKGDVCKDAVQIVLATAINGTEKLAGISSCNFKIVTDLNNFLDTVKQLSIHLNSSTISIGRGDAIEVRKKRMFGWKLCVLDEKHALPEYLKQKSSRPGK